MAKKGARRYSVAGKPKAWVLRDVKGRFKRWITKKSSVPADRAVKAKRKVRSGYGHLGDQKRR